MDRRISARRVFLLAFPLIMLAQLVILAPLVMQADVAGAVAAPDPLVAQTTSGPCGDTPCADVPVDQGPCGATPCAEVPVEQGPCGDAPCPEAPVEPDPCGGTALRRGTGGAGAVRRRALP